MNRRRLVRWLSFGLGAIVLGIQFVPAGRTNPPVAGSPVWASPRTEALARAACFDCHSNETDWPWYSRVAPLSWWIARNVREGRAKLNFSVPPFEEANESAESIQEGEMPPPEYVAMHGHARLSESERAELQAGLTRTFGAEGSEASDTRGQNGSDGRVARVN